MSAAFASGWSLDAARIERWAPVIRRWNSGIYVRICGEVFGDDRIPDGALVLTSAIARADGNLLTTVNGSTYVLGEPDPSYATWRQRIGDRIEPGNPFTGVWRPPM